MIEKEMFSHVLYVGTFKKMKWHYVLLFFITCNFHQNHLISKMRFQYWIIMKLCNRQKMGKQYYEVNYQKLFTIYIKEFLQLLGNLVFQNS